MARLLRDGTRLDQDAFSSEVLTAHWRLTSLRGPLGWQVPWPRALGTPPWAIARELTSLSGLQHRTHIVRWRRRNPVLLDTGPCALYVGSALLPRHVLLVLPGEPRRYYDPASGLAASIDVEAFARGRSPSARWRRTWFVIRA